MAHSHGWTLDGVEVFQLAPAERATLDEQYTLYHPSEVELGETIQAVLDDGRAGQAARASSSTRCRR